ncbi:MAG: gamma carbonic anhydrase family protein [Deltaproteobacteria bacterium]|nr:gamma carbonic anhydrase family protein [Deltaproteobacteria bacterium]MBW1924120.1 gamma carbonic anhydrase family protein [Deltaproteobacteria bacterium]MBW1949329.1 gamma carbonic anhydrase family protein [Deltaproteobacteria bacterium]
MMPIYEIDGKRPVIGAGTWIAPSAEIVGDVRIGRGCYIGFGAVIRADFGPIEIGDRAVVEECVVIHAGQKARVGARAIVGHLAMIHDAMVGPDTLVGMTSMICEGAVLEPWSIVAEKSLVRRGQVIPSGKIYAGSPARVAGPLTDRHRTRLVEGQQAYARLITLYRTRFRRLDFP